MGLLETIEKKRREVLQKRTQEGQGTLGDKDRGLQAIANQLAQKHKQRAIQLLMSDKRKEQSNAK